MKNELKAFIAQQRHEIENDMISNLLEMGRTNKIMIEKFGGDRVENESISKSKFSMFQVRQLIRLFDQSQNGKTITLADFPPNLAGTIKG